MPETIDIDAEFELGEASLRAGLSSPRGAGVVHRRQTWLGELRRWSLAFHNMNDARVARLNAIWEGSLFGSRRVTWTPPGESAGSYRLVDGSLVIRQVSANTYSASLELAEAL